MIKLISVSTFIFIIITFIGCEKNTCNKTDSVIDIKFNEKILEFYNYNLNDVINCKIDNNILVSARVTDTGTGLISEKENMDMNCGTGDIFNYDFKNSTFFDNKNELFLIVGFNTAQYNKVEIEFDFFHDNLSTNSTIEIDINENPDTLSLNNKFYNDVYKEGDELSNTIYYSMSKGLLKIEKNGTVKFSLL